MSVHREVIDLIDLVEAEPGWRVTRTTKGWQILAPDQSIAPIHLRDFRELDVTRTSLRRAGFAPLLRKKSLRSNEDMPVANGKAADVPPPPVAAPLARNLVREARSQIQVALDALSSIDQLLGEIEGEREQIQRLKEMFASVLK